MFVRYICPLAWVPTCVWVHTCVRAYGGQQLMAATFLDCSPPNTLRQGLTEPSAPLVSLVWFSACFRDSLHVCQHSGILMLVLMPRGKSLYTDLPP